MPHDLACDLENMLEKYYQVYVPGQTALQDAATVHDLTQHFKLPSDVGNYSLHPSPDTECGSDVFSKRMPLQLKDGNERSLLGVGTCVCVMTVSLSL